MRLLDDAEEFSPRRRMRVFLLTMIILKKKRESPTPRDKKSTHRYIYTRAHAYNIPNARTHAHTHTNTRARARTHTQARPVQGKSTGVGLKFECDHMHGYVRVKDLAPGGPAERCGVIDTGDILVDVGGQVCDL